MAGGVLNTVLVISILIAAITSTLILFAYYRNLILLQNTIKQDLRLNVSSGINYTLTSADLVYNQPHDFDLYGDGKDSVSIEKKPWGLFDIGLVTAVRTAHKAKKTFLIGTSLDKYGQAALYLADENRPLSVSGLNEIKGTAYLPKAGIKTAYMQNSGFLGEDAVAGAIKNSEAKLPTVGNDKIIRRILDYKNSESNLRKQTQALSRIQEQNLTNSFFNPALLYHTKDDLLVNNTQLRGHIIISTGKTLVLGKSARLDDVVLVASKVVIQKGFKGRVQVLASDTIEVEENVYLDYPSILSVYSPLNTGKINIAPNVNIMGIVFLDTPKQEYKLGNLLTIGERTTVTGQVYVNGLVEHKGSIYGSLMCRRFFLITPTTLYENYLINSTLDNTKLSRHFLTSSLLSSSHQYGVLKWLY